MPWYPFQGKPPENAKVIQIARDPNYSGIPIRNFYFDGTQSDLDRDLGVYLELARTYQKQEKKGSDAISRTEASRLRCL